MILLRGHIPLVRRADVVAVLEPHRDLQAVLVDGRRLAGQEGRQRRRAVPRGLEDGLGARAAAAAAGLAEARPRELVLELVQGRLVAVGRVGSGRSAWRSLPP